MIEFQSHAFYCNSITHYPLYYTNRHNDEVVFQSVSRLLTLQPSLTLKFKKNRHGDEVGFYFAFLSHYISCLLPLGGSGVLVFIILTYATKRPQLKRRKHTQKHNTSKKS